MATASENLPLELKQFYQRGVPQSLLIKGNSGTGKSTLAGEILDSLSKDAKCIGIFTRMDREDVLNNISCLGGMVNEGRLMILDKNDRIADPNLFGKEFEKLESQNHHTAVLFDTIEAIIEKFEKYESAQRKIRSLLKQVKSSRVHLIFIQEDAEATSMDYLVDGIVTLSRSVVQDKSIRTITLDKLRGVEIKRSKYLITLNAGSYKK